MAEFVGLDPAAASDLAAHLDEAAAELEAHARTVAGLLAQAGISSSMAPAELDDVASWARYRSRDLRRRISEITAAAGGGPGIHLRGFLFANRVEARKAGHDEAKRVGALLRSHDKKQLDTALADLKRYGNDPAYVAAFFKGLGPGRTYALLTATAGRDTAPVVGGALVLARRTGGITVKFIDGIITAARKAAAAVQAYTGAIPKALRVRYAQDEYVRREGSQHPDLVKYLEAIEPLTPYLEAGAKVAVIGGAVVIITGVAACVFLSDGACLGPAAEVIAGSGPIDAQGLQELEERFGEASFVGDIDAAVGSQSDAVLVDGMGSGTRTINLRPDAADPNWGLTTTHLEKHLFGDGPYSLSQVDPAGNADLWLGYIQDLAGRTPTQVLKDGVEDIIGSFTKADGSGTFEFGIRIARRDDGTWDLVTLLTRQPK